MNSPSRKFVAVAVVSMLLAVSFTAAHAYLAPGPIFAAQAAGLPRVNSWCGFLGGLVFPQISILGMALGILKNRRSARPEVK